MLMCRIRMSLHSSDQIWILGNFRPPHAFDLRRRHLLLIFGVPIAYNDNTARLDLEVEHVPLGNLYFLGFLGQNNSEP